MKISRYKNLLMLVLVVFSQQLISQELKGGRYGSGKGNRRAGASRLKVNKTDVFPLERMYKLGGPAAAFGITYLYPGKERSETLSLNDTTLSINTNPKGKIGLYLEAGWFHSFANPGLFHYIDFGLSYKQFRGEEEFERTLTNVSGGAIDQYNETREFNDNIISAHFNATNHWHFSRYGFLNNSIGVNVDYNLSGNRNDVEPVVAQFSGPEQRFPEQLMGQLHYKLGIGWKATPQLLIIPSIETPILTVYPYDDLKSTLPYFFSRYRPFIISIRFLFIRKDLENCNVPNYDGPANFE